MAQSIDGNNSTADSDYEGWILEDSLIISAAEAARPPNAFERLRDAVMELFPKPVSKSDGPKP